MWMDKNLKIRVHFSEFEMANLRKYDVHIFEGWPFKIR
jgi:hypothetical protein